MTEPPWSELDPGIRDTVRALWLAGFETIDSGDGTKDMECAIDVPAVFMRCEPSRLIEEAERLHALATSWGMPLESEEYGSTVQASYSPADGMGVLILFGAIPKLRAVA